jgi:hypothetical protein
MEIIIGILFVFWFLGAIAGGATGWTNESKR